MTRGLSIRALAALAALPLLLTACSGSFSIGAASSSGATNWKTAQQALDGLKAAGISCQSATASGSPSVITPDPTATDGLGYMQIPCQGFYVAIITDDAAAKETDKKYFCDGTVSQADLDRVVNVVGDGFNIAGFEGDNYGTWPADHQPDTFLKALPGTTLETDAAYKKRICA